MVQLTGTPVVLDAMVRPLARTVQLVVGGLPTLALLWFEVWFWAPMPLVASFAVYELVFWWRGDRPVVLTLDTTRLTLQDPRAGRGMALSLDDIQAATLHVRPSMAEARMEAVLVLADARRVCFAARFLVEPDLPLRREDVQADAMEAFLGGFGGLSALAPPACTCRQTIDDPAGQAIRWLRERLPPHVWQRTALRLWRGEAPPLDAFALHEGPPDGLLVLDGEQWTLRTDERTSQGTVTLVRSGRATRTIELYRKPSAFDEEPAGTIPTDTLEVPLLILDLDQDLSVVFPAPAAGTQGDARDPDELWWHTHVPEGSAAVWHVITRWPEPAWPVALRRAATDVLAQAAPMERSPRAPGRGARSVSRGS